MKSKNTFYNSLILSVLLATFVSLGFTPAAPLEQSAALASGGSESVTVISENNRTLGELEAAEPAAEPQEPNEEPFLMLIDGVFSIKGRGTVVTGRVARGTAQAGDQVEIIGFDVEIRKTVMTSVEMFKKSSDQVETGDNVDQDAGTDMDWGRSILTTLSGIAPFAKYVYALPYLIGMGFGETGAMGWVITGLLALYTFLYGWLVLEIWRGVKLG